LLAVIWILTGLAQDAPKSSLIDSGQLLSDLRVLSADDMQGRRTATPGGEKARAFHHRKVQGLRDSSIRDKL
jgi:hypothetical protein